MKIEVLRISDLVPYEKNTKKHPAKQVQQIANSIREFGFNQPIVADKNNVVIVGHGRMEAAMILGLTEVPVMKVDITEEQAKAYRLADNKLNESEWDMDLVIEELKGLSDEMMDLTGFDRDLLIEPDEKDDEVPAVPDAPRSIIGDLYELGDHRVLCGDSTQLDAVERLMDGKKADMVFTDPPYGMNLETDYSKRDSSGTTLAGMKSMQNKGTYNAFSKLQRGKYSAVIGDDKQYNPSHIFRDFDYCKEIFLWGADYYAEFLPDKNDGSWIVWDKRAGIEHVKFTLSEFELCWSKQHHARTIARFQWFGVMGLSKEDTKKRIHPTQKPVTLLSWFLTNFSGEEHTIVDLFLGSGSTLIASEKTGRICYGMELDEKYIDVIIERWCQFTGIRNIKKNGQDYYWEAKQ